MPYDSGWPELDDAMDSWTAATGALPGTVHDELSDTLGAAERGEVILAWDATADGRTAFLKRFPHPFARVFDHVMLYESLTLGLSGPMVQFPPVAGLVLRKNMGTTPTSEPPASPTEMGEIQAYDADEFGLLRALIRSVTSDERTTPPAIGRTRENTRSDS